MLVQAFLQRVANGQGSVLREFPLGQRRADLMLRWPLGDGTFQKIVIELKVLRWDRGTKDNPAKFEASGIEQAADYARRCQGDEVHLLLCSRGTPPAGYERVFRRTATASDGRSVTVWGM